MPLAKIRETLGRLVSGLLALVFEHAWPRRVILHGLSPRSKAETAREVAADASPDEEVARIFLSKLEPERAMRLAIDTSLGRVPEGAKAGLSDAIARATGGVELDRLIENLTRLATEDARTLVYSRSVFQAILRWLETHAGGVSKKRILELGPGHSLATAALLVASGAESWVGVNAFPLAQLRVESVARLRRAILEPGLPPDADRGEARDRFLRRFDDLLRIEGDAVRVDEKRLTWRYPVDAASLPFPDASFDVVLSNATLEHVRDPSACVRESMRVLVPGGFGVHQIDLKDHRDTTRPFEFLRLDAAAWRAVFEPGENGSRLAFEYTNRWRRGDFQGAFAAAGAEIMRADSTEEAAVTDELRRSLHADFRDRDDLDSLSAFFVVRKPVPSAAAVS